MIAPTARVLFVCTGNYYRSRFAEAVFNHLAMSWGLPWRAFSRGLAVHLASGDLSPHTARALAERGIDRGATGPTRVSLARGDLESAQTVVAIDESEHRPLLRAQFPDWEDRVTYWDIEDVELASPELALPELERRVSALLQGLARDRPPAGTARPSGDGPALAPAPRGGGARDGRS